MSTSNYDSFVEASKVFDNGDLDLAVLKFSQILKVQPRSGPVLYMLGKVHLSRGDARDAELCLMEANKIDPNDEDTLVELGNAQEELGKVDEAEHSWKAALAVYEGCVPAYINIGRLYIERGNYTAATEVFDEGLRHSDYLLLNKGRAIARMESGRFAEAIEDLNLCLAAAPAAAVLYGYRSRCRLGLGRLADAVKDIEMAIKLAPEDESYATLLRDIQKRQQSQLEASD